MTYKCSCGKVDDFEGIINEIVAGKSLSIGVGDNYWNRASDRAIAIVKKYQEGRGLFQLCPVHGFDKTENELDAPSE